MKVVCATLTPKSVLVANDLVFNYFWPGICLDTHVLMHFILVLLHGCNELCLINDDDDNDDNDDYERNTEYQP